MGGKVNCISYKKGYKFQLVRPYVVMTEVRPHNAISVDGYVHLAPNGRLAISLGYAWDGATAAPDYRSVLRASLVHDALYQLIGIRPRVVVHLGQQMF